MRTGKYILLIILSILVLACEKMEDIQLTETIFIEDPYAPGLPVYSEWGYNTFGAYIDRKAFISTNNDLPAKIIVNDDILHLILRGQMGTENVDLKFSIKGFSPATNFDLTELDSTTINLKEAGHSVTLKIGNETNILQLIEGELIINNVQRLYIDSELSKTIISGYFNFKTFFGNEPIAISYGRFDLGIGYENFYNY